MNWQEILNQIIDILLPLLATFLTGLFTYIGTRLKAMYQEKINTDVKKQVIDDVVRFVEQVYKDVEGEKKLQFAINEASKILNEKGISITQTEINMLIESAVYGLNKGTKELKKLEESK